MKFFFLFIQRAAEKNIFLPDQTEKMRNSVRNSQHRYVELIHFNHFSKNKYADNEIS